MSAATRGWLEAQVAACLHLRLVADYRHWSNALFDHLVQNGTYYRCFFNKQVTTPMKACIYSVSLYIQDTRPICYYRGRGFDFRSGKINIFLYVTLISRFKRVFHFCHFTECKVIDGYRNILI